MLNDVSLHKKRTGRIMLLGNSVNLVAGKNSHLRYESVLKTYAKNDKLDKEFFKECLALEPSFVHHALSELNKKVDAYLTTNYDRAMEKALKLKFSKVKNVAPSVHHMHGEASNPEECIFFESDYKRALSDIHKNDWYADFQQNEIHIVGLTLRKEELVLYLLLEDRRQKIAALPDFEYDNTIKPVYAWLTYEEHEKADTEQLAEKLMALSVVPILIPVYDKDYISAWERILGKFMLHCQKIHVSKAECKALRSAKTPQQSTRGKSISYSSSRSLKYPERVHIKIAKSSLRKHSNKSHWYFYCEIDLQPRIWCVPMVDLLQIESCDSSLGHIHLYLDYRTGELYAKTLHNESPAEKVLTCTSVQDSQIPDTSCFSVQETTKQ